MSFLKRPFLAIGTLTLLTWSTGGCVRDSAAKTPVVAAKPVQVWGERGTRGGEFYEPRAITIARNGFAYLVDSSGRVQKWTKDGRFVKAWLAPSVEKGRPKAWLC
jgi:hypothetical protein